MVRRRRSLSPRASTRRAYEVGIRKGFERARESAWLARGIREPRSRRGLVSRVRFARHPDYCIERDLVHELEIPAWKAVLGGVSVPTPEGRCA
jgi:hypothetical protein